MRSAWWWSGGSWSLLLTGIAALAYSSRASLTSAIAAASPVSRTESHPAPAYPAESLSQIVSARDLFRSSRTRAAVSYDPNRTNGPLPDTPPKPQLALVGIVSGKDPSALIEGFPGIEGTRVVRVGDVVAGLRVKQIDVSAVRVVGMDTVWLLTVREPWKQ